MDFFDGSFGMWIQLVKYSAFCVAVAYGMYRRWYVRLWPLYTLGFILDIGTQLIFTDHEMHGVGWLWGLLVYPIYCILGGMMGVGIGAFIEWRWPHFIAQGIDAPDMHLYAVMEEAARRQAFEDKQRLKEHDIPVADHHIVVPQNSSDGPTPEQIISRLKNAGTPPPMPAAALATKDESGKNKDRDAA